MTRFIMVSCKSSDLIHTLPPPTPTPAPKHFGLSFMVSLLSACLFQGNGELEAILIVFFRRLLWIFNISNNLNRYVLNVFKEFFNLRF